MRRKDKPLNCSFHPHFLFMQTNGKTLLALLAILATSNIKASPLFGARALAEMNNQIDGTFQNQVELQGENTFTVNNNVGTKVDGTLEINAPIKGVIRSGGAQLQIGSVAQNNEGKVSFRNNELFHVGYWESNGQTESISNTYLDFNADPHNPIGYDNNNQRRIHDSTQRPHLLTHGNYEYVAY